MIIDDSFFSYEEITADTLCELIEKKSRLHECRSFQEISELLGAELKIQTLSEIVYDQTQTQSTEEIIPVDAEEGEAERLMLDVHNNGQAVVGVYSYDMARTKVGQVTMMAQEKIDLFEYDSCRNQYLKEDMDKYGKKIY